MAGLVSMFIYFSASLPPVGALLEGYDPPQTTRIYASDGAVIGELFEERRTVVPLEGIPQVMVDAVIAAEDADFREHKGLDYPGMIRAMLVNITSGKLSQGASTITQQVARTFFLTREKTFSRKIREILLTKRIEERLTKDQILFLYLNQINFGYARYGVQEAASFYFGKNVTQLTVSEAALLAGLPKGPALYSPTRHPEAAKKRRAYVLGEMQKLGMIDEDTAEAAREAPITSNDDPGYDPTLAPEAVSSVVAELSDVIGKDLLQRGGFNIETTIDPRLQRAARRAVIEGLQAIDARHGRLAPYKAPKKKQAHPPAPSLGPLREGKTYPAVVTGYDVEKNRLLVAVGEHPGFVEVSREGRYNPKSLPLKKFAEVGARLHVSLRRAPREGEPMALQMEQGPQAALVALSASDGRILALVGGDEVMRGGFDRATFALRQPGSAFKPLVYLAALRTGRYTPATLVDDSPEVQGGWQPQNSHPDEYSGAVRLREALAQSLNLPAVKLITDIGPESVMELAGQLGVNSRIEATPSLALGASSVSPLEMASVYAAFASGGKKITPWLVAAATKTSGQSVPLFQKTPLQAISPQEAFIITSMLTSVVREGTGARAGALGRPTAGKTGTSNEGRDAWFVGYTPDIVCAVWVGYDDHRPLGRREQGSRAALPIWLSFMQTAHEGLPQSAFVPPETGIVFADIDPRTGLLAYEGMEDAIGEVFIAGTEPTQTAVPPELVAPDDFLLQQLAAPAPDPDTDADSSTGEDAPLPVTSAAAATP